MNDTNFVDPQPTKDHEICHYQTSPPCDRQEHGDRDDEPGTLDLNHKKTLKHSQHPCVAASLTPETLIIDHSIPSRGVIGSQIGTTADQKTTKITLSNTDYCLIY